MLPEKKRRASGGGGGGDFCTVRVNRWKGTHTPYKT